MKLFTASLATLVALVSVIQATPTHQFDHFFPGWNARVQAILRDNCSEPYAEYLTGNVNQTLGKLSLVNPVIDCVLEAFPESRKAELATGALVLGLIPTILQSIGSSTAETALVGLRRPLLGFLISAGSPAVSMMKTSEFATAIAELAGGHGAPEGFGIASLRWSRGRGTWALLIGLVQYVAVGAAVANVLHLAWELGIYAVAIFAPDTVFGVPLWTLGAAAIHLAGCLAVWVRVRTRILDARDDADYAALSKPLNTWVPNQFIPAVFHPPIVLELRQDAGSSVWFYILSWVISIGILAQVAFGTLVLSGLLFFSLVDCLTIVGRYTLSAVVCRAVVRFELSGMMAALVPAHSKHTNEALEPEQVVLTDWKGVRRGM
ncbi:hypothetical protein SAMD00023353_2401440 [Rosellinia necatrix]|uniref:Uncharacterized protein n=1 Tax=Rosellinia necatrix TaxID=77044 RepID=A0A1W2TFY3_ROSNE|nr:hypothetical protein SAMD00023353_2401440 [Rosellinia necatrix]